MNRCAQALSLAVALTLFGAIQAGLAQDLENARRLSERWCAACHAIGAAPGRGHRAPAFAAIAAKDNITAEMIASFLRMPHATMPNFPLSRQDADDLAALIMEMRK